MTNSSLPARNEAWGFYGTAAGFTDPDQAWAVAFPAVATVTRATAEGVRDFLDSRHGRHFADDVANGLHRGDDLGAAVEAAITRWMSWTINSNTARETGIPKGLPYLTGFVTQCEIEAEQAD